MQESKVPVQENERNKIQAASQEYLQILKQPDSVSVYNTRNWVVSTDNKLQVHRTPQWNNIYDSI